MFRFNKNSRFYLIYSIIFFLYQYESCFLSIRSYLLTTKFSSFPNLKSLESSSSINLDYKNPFMSNAFTHKSNWERIFGIKIYRSVNLTPEMLYSTIKIKYILTKQFPLFYLNLRKRSGNIYSIFLKSYSSISFIQNFLDLEIIIFEALLPKIYDGKDMYQLKSYAIADILIQLYKVDNYSKCETDSVIRFQLNYKFTLYPFFKSSVLPSFSQLSNFFIPQIKNRYLLDFIFFANNYYFIERIQLIKNQRNKQSLVQFDFTQKNIFYKHQQRVINLKLFRKQVYKNIQSKLAVNYKNYKKRSQLRSKYSQTIKTKMIKHVMINRFSDGTVFCQTNQDYHNNELQNVKMKVKNYHREVTPYNKSQNTNIRQIQNPHFGIYYKISSYVVFTIIVEPGYPLKLTNIFLDTVANAFFDEAKTILGSHDLPSRLQSIEGSHYFVKFDRIIKQKKKQFDDPKTLKNSQRMKKQLQSIQQIMKENMSMINTRHKQLLQTEQKARKVNEESKRFEKISKKVKWNMWFKKNLIWVVLVITIIILGWLFV